MCAYKRGAVLAGHRTGQVFNIISCRDALLIGFCERNVSLNSHELGFRLAVSGRVHQHTALYTVRVKLFILGRLENGP